MEPRIQYAHTTDRVSIAFHTLGDGPAFIEMPWFPSTHIQLEWQFPEIRRWYERLAQRSKLVRYDGRGTGLSDRNVTDYSLDAQVRDLEAVVDRLGSEKFALMALAFSGPVAIAYAARHPERVSHLLLWCSCANASDLVRWSQIEALVGLVDANWDLFTETLAHAVLGWSEGEPARRMAELFREGSTPEATKALWDAIRQFDASDLLGQVRSPTLVLHRRQFPFGEVGIARNLAARIPDARLTIVEGTSPAPQQDDAEAVLQAIDEFLGEGPEAAAAAQAPEAGAFRTVLFTDVECSYKWTVEGGYQTPQHRATSGLP